MSPLKKPVFVICMFYHERNRKSDLSEERKSMRQDDLNVKSFMETVCVSMFGVY